MADARPLRRDELGIGALVNGKYKLVAQIGAGGMGKVFKAEQQPLGRLVALKVVHPHLGHEAGGSKSEGGPEAFQKRFFREASAQAQLRHRNIVTVYDYGLIEGSEGYFMVMEYLEGEPLSAQLRGGKRMEQGAAVEVLRQVARGLREVHKAGLVHRDLKPANVFLAVEGDETVCKLLDFGLVKQVRQTGDPDELTAAGTLLGSPTYMAPEQIEGQAIDQRSDLYALGAVVYHCLAGRPPFEGSLTQVMMQHVHQPVPLLSERGGVGVIAPLERVVRRCLEKAPSDRYQSADELLRDVRQCEAELGVVPAGSGAHSLTTTGARKLTAEEAGSLVSLAKSDAVTRVDVPAPAGQAGAAQGRGKLLVGVAAAAAVGALAVGALLLRPAAGGPGAQGVASAAPTASAEAPARKGVLSLGSVPAGAQVLEGERVLGVTPLELPLEGQGTRRFTLKLEGYEVFQIEQPPSGDAVKVMVPLRALPEAPPKPTAVGGKGRTRPPPPATAAATTPSEPPPPAIRLTR